MKSFAGFSEIRFSLNRPSRSAVVKWSGDDSITANVMITDNGTVHLFQQIWKGKPVGSADLDKCLQSVSNLTSTGGATYKLELARGDKERKSLSWSEENETKELGQLRVLLDQTLYLYFSESLACMKRGRALKSAGAPDDAIAMIREGIDVLGDRYIDEPIPDDTSMKLSLAEVRYDAGDSDQAYALLDRVLESRVQVYFENFLKKRGFSCDAQGDGASLGVDALNSP